MFAYSITRSEMPGRLQQTQISYRWYKYTTYVMLFIMVIYEKNTRNYAGLKVLSVNHVIFAPP